MCWPWSQGMCGEAPPCSGHHNEDVSEGAGVRETEVLLFKVPCEERQIEHCCLLGVTR